MKRYVLREPPPAPIFDELSGYSEVLSKLLYYRGIQTRKEAETFLNSPYEESLHDPFLILGMEKAVDRILRAISAGEKIVVWSDYDHDGGPGGVILREFFHAIGYKNFENYIPHRYREGYGLNEPGVETLCRSGARLIITVDCGITDVGSVALAKDLGTDTIITDHHLPAGELPEAYAILNSKQKNCSYPFDMLCGAAVAWKLVVALLKRGRFRVPEGFSKWLLDLVGLSTLADMVPLVGENRVLARYGLLVLRKTRRAGLRALFSEIGVNFRFLNEDDVGFMIAPRLNAASRMADPRIAFDLLVSSEEDAPALARELNALNAKRKSAVAALVREIKTSLKDRGVGGSVITLGNPSWRPGLLGLAATSVIEDFGKPVFLWGREGGSALKGSCRSRDVDLVALMKAVRPGVFLEFGGHAASGGFSLSEDHVHHLPEYLEEACASLPKASEVAEETFLDGILSVGEINEFLWREVNKLSPFGVGNPKPVFLIEDGIILEKKSFGKNKEHLSLVLQDGAGRRAKSVRFFANDWVARDRVPNLGEKVKLVATLEKSYFGRPEVRLRMEDLI